jgi:hypothetical protein
MKDGRISPTTATMLLLVLMLVVLVLVLVLVAPITDLAEIPLSTTAIRISIKY